MNGLRVPIGVGLETQRKSAKVSVESGHTHE
jgi:hypothetical protein